MSKQKQSFEEFVLRLNSILRTEGVKGILEEFPEFSAYFSDEDILETLEILIKEKKIGLRILKHGVQISIREISPVSNSAEMIIGKLGLTSVPPSDISYEDFFRKAVVTLRYKDFKGIHSVYSGFNQAFKKYYGEEPVRITVSLSKEGKIATRPAKGGILLYLPEDAPGGVSIEKILEKMGLRVDDTTRIAPEDFIKRAITALRREGYKGIHSVYSGFNETFKAYFGTDPVEITNKLAKEGVIGTRPVKGGVMLYLPEDAPVAVGVEGTLEKMGLRIDDTTKISHAEFFKKAITSLRKEGYKGIHSVYSGFNEAFKKYFGDKPIEVTNKLSKEGVIATRPVRGGVMLYLPEDAPSTLEKQKSG